MSAAGLAVPAVAATVTVFAGLGVAWRLRDRAAAARLATSDRCDTAGLRRADGMADAA